MVWRYLLVLQRRLLYPFNSFKKGRSKVLVSLFNLTWKNDIDNNLENIGKIITVFNETGIALSKTDV